MNMRWAMSFNRRDTSRLERNHKSAAPRQDLPLKNGCRCKIRNISTNIIAGRGIVRVTFVAQCRPVTAAAAGRLEAEQYKV